MAGMALVLNVRTLRGTVNSVFTDDSFNLAYKQVRQAENDDSAIINVICQKYMSVKAQNDPVWTSPARLSVAAITPPGEVFESTRV